MDTISLILSIITTLFSSLNLIIGLFYLIPIIILPRFHHRNHFLTLNVCIANILCCLVWFPDDPLFRNDSTTTMRNIQTIFTLQVPFSFVIVSIHRYCSVVYRKKTFFKSRRWICLCVGIQWILGILLSIPDLMNFHKVKIHSLRFEEDFLPRLFLAERRSLETLSSVHFYRCYSIDHLFHNEYVGLFSCSFIKSSNSTTNDRHTSTFDSFESS